MSVLPKTLVYISTLFALLLVHYRWGCHAAAVSNNEPELYSGCVVCVCLSCVRHECMCGPVCRVVSNTEQKYCNTNINTLPEKYCNSNPNTQF